MKWFWGELPRLQVSFLMEFTSAASNWLIYPKAWNKSFWIWCLTDDLLVVVERTENFSFGIIFIPIFDFTADENYFSMSPLFSSFSLIVISNMWTKAKGKPVSLLTGNLCAHDPMCLNSHFPSLMCLLYKYLLGIYYVPGSVRTYFLPHRGYTHKQ